MYNTSVDFDDTSTNQLNLVMFTAARLALDDVSADEFLEWSQLALPSLSPKLFESAPAEDLDRIAYWVGVNLWNAAPLPANQFKPNPLPKPSRNQSCPCGSGLKFKQCCSRLPNLEPLSTDAYWPFFAQTMSKSYMNELATRLQLPLHAVGTMADYFFTEEDYQQAIKLLEPYFAGRAGSINHRHVGLLDLLCDCYNAHYKSDRKKQDLLDRITQHKDPVIRAEAWQRIASWQQDLGNEQAAMQALNKAMQADPKNPNHAILELTLLVSSDRIDQAKQRAAFWAKKLKHYEHEHPELLDILHLAQSDPLAALQSRLYDTESDTRLSQLLDWIDNNYALQLPLYEVIDVERSDSDYDADIHPDSDPLENAVTLSPPQHIRELEIMWREFSPTEKPFSIQFEPMCEDNPWDEIFDTDWLAFLQQHPEAINSLEILDDVVTLLYTHPDNDTAWGQINNIPPLLIRTTEIIQQMQIPEPKKLPWIMTENRPALRMLAHYISFALENDAQKAMQLIKFYLQLNPNDNHGFRGLLINDYLQNNMNEAALALCNHYPNDMLAEITYGRILAQYRLDHLQDAEQSIKVAIEQLPKVAEYLIKTRVAKPEINDFGFNYGGEDQAWLYRQDMREAWKQTPGCLDWLGKWVE